MGQQTNQAKEVLSPYRQWLSANGRARNRFPVFYRPFHVALIVTAFDAILDVVLLNLESREDLGTNLVPLGYYFG